MSNQTNFKIVIIGTCDTKLEELLYICDYVSRLSNSLKADSFSITPVLINTGKPSESSHHQKISISIHSLFPFSTTYSSRNDLIASIGGALKSYLLDLVRDDKIHGVLAIGGSCGSSIVADALQSLPFGFPKVLLSTMASGDIKPYIGCSDVSVLYSVVDISGLNSLLKQVLENAAGTVVGMVKSRALMPSIVDSNAEQKKKVAISMFGITTPACDAARAVLEKNNCEVYVFHATGSGGMAMEKLILDGTFDGVLDLTTTELADEAFGGVLSAGSERLKGAAKVGIPTVVSTGALDCINFGPKETVPEKYKERKIHVHNNAVTVVRTNEAENEYLGKIICGRLLENSCAGQRHRIQVWLPLKSVSIIDQNGSPFGDKRADTALHETITVGLCDTGIKVVAKDLDINDERFAEGVAAALLEAMGNR
ncbi:hypothetical protein TWF106_000217 [Orbilia oligospora]|uniref:Uncharacterized protein n=1 Tax=Orbilia oligospora TaxID=2813651 RepID=A0A6G1MLE5_ORBOL|nr:hypothetical protein TWF191_010109 [Orbilia oligospora]KAF3229628.1 hypothetical protein TWF106_000016 [Orbilia oligospora]KAF3229828.1 hypothetical protein TWF106_000217 [Orbilia oligospora]KAF3262526.1 hypothetical protein TWF192_007198 [Orbilia oligospora]